MALTPLTCPLRFFGINDTYRGVIVLRSLFSLALILVASAASAQDFTKSAHRVPGSSYLGYKSFAQMFSINTVTSQNIATPMSSARANVVATLPKATEWENEKVMAERFQYFRDLRFMQTASKPNFPRRSSWMYPDDGCFARAALAVRNLVQHSTTAPKKVFAFGDLRVKTQNSPDGEVTWWYHVAPLVEVAGQKYVLDPALQPERPLKLEEWLALMSDNPSSIEVSVCESGSYTPGDDCTRSTDGIESGAESDQVYYLDAEWRRLVELNRNPDQELGEHPPWLH